MASPPLTQPIGSTGVAGMRKRWGLGSSGPRADDNSDNDDDGRAPRLLRLHDKAFRNATGQAVRPCLRIRRSRARYAKDSVGGRSSASSNCVDIAARPVEIVTALSLAVNTMVGRETAGDDQCSSAPFLGQREMPEITPCPTGGQVVQRILSLAGGGLPGRGHRCQMTTVLTTVTTVGPSTTPPTAPKCTYRAWSRLLPAPGSVGVRGSSPLSSTV
jgi:hypothetical protein